MPAPPRFRERIRGSERLHLAAPWRRAHREPRAIVRSDAGTSGRVGIVTGGGSGHLPVFLDLRYNVAVTVPVAPIA